MRPATPKHPKHDAACPGCGEPFQTPWVMGMTAAELRCGRCLTHFLVIGRKTKAGPKLSFYSLPDKEVMAAWQGEPLPASEGKRWM